MATPPLRLCFQDRNVTYEVVKPVLPCIVNVKNTTATCWHRIHLMLTYGVSKKSQGNGQAKGWYSQPPQVLPLSDIRLLVVMTHSSFSEQLFVLSKIHVIKISVCLDSVSAAHYVLAHLNQTEPLLMWIFAPVLFLLWHVKISTVGKKSLCWRVNDSFVLTIIYCSYRW